MKKGKRNLTFIKPKKCAVLEDLVFDKNPENIQCPVCGYYCLGKGGYGCIDKPNLQELSKKKEG